MKSTNNMNQQNKTERWVAVNNPSYDKSLSERDRLGDFLGKYHVILNGVVKHDPYVIPEEDGGGGMCCQSHKLEILDFVDQLLSDARREERERIKNGIEGWWNENGGYHWASPWGLFLKKLLKASQPLTTAEESIKKLK